MRAAAPIARSSVLRFRRVPARHRIRCRVLLRLCLGLGLAVAFSLVKKHGGHLSLDPAEGEGARFTVLLPAAAPRRRARRR